MSREPSATRDKVVEEQLDEFFSELRSTASKLWDDEFGRKTPLRELDQVDLAFASLCVLNSGQVASVGFVQLGRLIHEYTTGGWTESKNRRRLELIEEDVAETIGPIEAGELAMLQAKAERHVDQMHPLPIEMAQQLEKKLSAMNDDRKSSTDPTAD